MLPFTLPRAGQFGLLLVPGLLLLSARPAHAEYGWNPFGHLTDQDLQWLGGWLVAGAVAVLLGWPLMSGGLTYLVLFRLYPSRAVNPGWLLLWACLGQWAMLLVALLPYSDYLLLDDAVWLAPAGAAAWSYFRQRRAAESAAR